MTIQNQNPKIPPVSSSSRRTFIGVGVTGLVGSTMIAKLLAAPSTVPQVQDVSIEQFNSAGKSAGLVKVAKIVKNETQWRAQLSALVYQVTRQEGTERAYSGTGGLQWSRPSFIAS